ncbi:unnamed protein product [Trichobilharzia szidati]|nr:unnamed protein product [Trichobilharzia szidati]
MQNLLLQALLCLLLLLSNNNAFDEYLFVGDHEEDDPDSTLNVYADSYRQVVNDKFFMIEPQTYRDPKNAEETIKTEILRLERLYQRKWEKEFLETISAEDKSLVNLANYEYRKALEDDNAFQHNVFANHGRYHQLKMHISKKWENRKNLDIAEAKFFADTSSILKKDEAKSGITKKIFEEEKEAVNTTKADLQKLQKAAVIASNAYRKTSTYLQSIRKGNYKNETPNDAEITQAYWKARYDFDNGTRILLNKIKQLEMSRIEFLMFQTPEYRINWLLDEMKEDAKQYY